VNYHSKLAQKYLSSFPIIGGLDEGKFSFSELNGFKPRCNILFDRFAATQIKGGCEYFENPASLYHPSLLYRAMERFSSSRKNIQLSDFDLQQIVGIAHRYFSRNGLTFKRTLNPATHGKLQVLSPEAALSKILTDKSNKAAGFPYNCKKKDVSDPISFYEKWILNKFDAISSIGYRTQRNGKVRPI
jgi:hypothetical protein